MLTIFTTRSGATYVATETHLTRVSDEPIANFTAADLPDHLAGEPFEWIVEPRVGERAIYHLATAPAGVESTTTRIMSVKFVNSLGWMKWGEEVA